MSLHGQRINLVDTPGFDDTDRSDGDILKEVASFLATTYKRRVLLTGIVYLHPIFFVRMTGASMRNLRLFKELVGAEGLSRVVLATTMWDTGEQSVFERREEELLTIFWRSLIEQGSTVHRLNGQREAALSLLSTLVQSAHEDGITVQIQRELIDDRKTLDQTAAGQSLAADFEKLSYQYKEELKRVSLEMNSKIEEQTTELLQLVEDLKEKSTDLEQETKSLHRDYRTMLADATQRAESLEDQLKSERTEKDKIVQNFQEELTKTRLRAHRDNGAR